jgi:hypothetical protein
MRRRMLKERKQGWIVLNMKRSFFISIIMFLKVLLNFIP